MSDVQGNKNVPEVRAKVQYYERPESPDVVFRLHYRNRKLCTSRVPALFNWLSSYCTRECPVWPKEPKKRKVQAGALDET